MHYFILSLKHSPCDGLLMWWRKDAQEYTAALNEAGIYGKEEVDGNAAYYNNGESTLAVEVRAAIKLSRPVVGHEMMATLKRIGS